jgi:cytochrome c oxidase cbb3-type subunit 1
MLPPSPAATRQASFALVVWCGALAAGAISWLSGGASGRLFLSWSGASSFLFAGAQFFLWVVLVVGMRRRWHLGLDGKPRRLIDAAFLGALFFVPIALFLAAQPGVYPPVNPHSGGATGHSLLASSLGIAGIGLALPFLLGRTPNSPIKRPATIVTSIYLLNWLVYAAIDHGNASNHEPTQIAGLSTLLVWPPLFVWWFRMFDWNANHHRWLLSSALWTAFLVIDGLVIFLPPVLEGAKFTHSIVAHAHLAMAGLLTSLNLLMLISLASDSDLGRKLAGRSTWLAWNLACLGMVVALTVLGWFEGENPLLVPYGGTMVTTVYVVRLLLGAVMAAVGAHWLIAAIRSTGTIKSANTQPSHFNGT